MSFNIKKAHKINAMRCEESSRHEAVQAQIDDTQYIERCKNYDKINDIQIWCQLNGGHLNSGVGPVSVCGYCGCVDH